jgi:microcystin-dependent protein
MPSHNHVLNGATVAALNTNVAVPSSTTYISNVGAKATPTALPVPGRAYAPSTATPMVFLSPAVVGAMGSNQAHNNMMPYVAMNYCIALQGEFPQRS